MNNNKKLFKDLKENERCHSQRDGDCTWEYCPQNRDKEPETSGRHCPLDWNREEDYQ